MVSNYAYQIASMRWSYSRLRAYEDCGYGFFLKYLYEEEEQGHFYAEYGSLMHHILERFYNKSITKEQAFTEFCTGFVLKLTTDVKPNISEKYYEQGKAYLLSLEMPDEKIVGIEEQLDFEIEGNPFIGFIDLLLEDGGELIIQDHKSRILQPKSFVKGNKTERKNNDEFDSFAKQLYLYSAGVEQRYGRLPKEIRFNCFRNGTVVTEKFDKEKYKEAKSWAVETIGEIKHETEWNPNIEWFKCNNICGFTKTCEYCGTG